MAQLYSSSGAHSTGKSGAAAMLPMVSFILLFLPLERVMNFEGENSS
jgi:hypothetical protein